MEEEFTRVSSRYNTATLQFIVKADEIANYYHYNNDKMIDNLYEKFFIDVYSRLELEKLYENTESKLINIEIEQIIGAILYKFYKTRTGCNKIMAILENHLTNFMKSLSKFNKKIDMNYKFQKSIEYYKDSYHTTTTTIDATIPILLLRIDLHNLFKYVVENYDVSLKTDGFYDFIINKVKKLTDTKTTCSNEEKDFAKFLSDVLVPDNTRLICQKHHQLMALQEEISYMSVDS
jgi:hypothetical protein